QETGLSLEKRLVIGSHGGEFVGEAFEKAGVQTELTDEESSRLEMLLSDFTPLVEAVKGAWIEEKPRGFAVHTRAVAPAKAGRALLDDLAERAGELRDVWIRDGKMVREFSVRRDNKGLALNQLREVLPAAPVLFV